MDKKTILDYVTETPGNTNRAVLESMLDSIESGSSDNTDLITIVFDGYITTEAPEGSSGFGSLGVFNKDGEAVVLPDFDTQSFPCLLVKEGNNTKYSFLGLRTTDDYSATYGLANATYNINVNYNEAPDTGEMHLFAVEPGTYKMTVAFLNLN